MPQRDEPPSPAATIKFREDPTRTMKSVQWFGTKDMRVKEAPVPLVTDEGDVVLKVTSSCICGSDLHIYTGNMPGMKSGDLMGHEFMGEVVEVGPGVKSLRPGDRAVASFDIGCGTCYFCKREAYSGCDSTNPSKEQEALYGDRSTGMFGYSHLTGGWARGQAEYARVPFADVNCLKVPPGMSDDKVILLSDILPTAWHACELGQVGEGDTVAIWGAGPVGMLAAHCAFARGASHVATIDCEEDRLRFVRDRIPSHQGRQLSTINFKEHKTVPAVRDLFPHGPDVAIEAVGFHYTKSFLHWFEMALKLETDPSETLNELITAVRKGGRIGVVGVYAGYANHFNIGAFMEKGLSMAAGQTPCQKYWPTLLPMIEEGKLDATWVVTHHLPLDDAARAYKMFNDKEDCCIKVILHPAASEGAAARAER